METNKKKSIIIGSIILIALVAVFAVIYAFNKPAAKAGSKDIVIEVTSGNGSTTDYSLSTDAEFLIQAMDELAANGSGFSYSGSDSDYGIMVDYVNGEKAIYAEDGAYWALYVNGEYGQYGADSQPVESGSTYTWTYEKAQ
jgi:hypothetical protein